MAQHIIANLDQTREFAAKLAKNAKPGEAYCLNGDLGSGKTEFSREFIKTLCGNVTVTSPTFNIVQFYEPNIYHFDLYRIEDPEELYEIGFDEALENICLIEWPDIALNAIHSKIISIRFEILDEQTRKIIVND